MPLGSVGKFTVLVSEIAVEDLFDRGYCFGISVLEKIDIHSSKVSAV